MMGSMVRTNDVEDLYSQRTYNPRLYTDTRIDNVIPLVCEGCYSRYGEEIMGT